MAPILTALLLLTVLFGSAFPTVLGDAAAAMAPGEWKDITASMNGFNAGSVLVPSSNNGNIIQYSEEANWDPVGKNIFIIGTARPYTYPENQGFVKYSEVNNTWQALPTQPFNLGFHSYDHAAMNPATGDFYLRVVGSGAVWRYSPVSAAWSQLPDIQMDIVPCCAALEFFPEMGGLVFFNGRDDGEVYFHKLGTNAWSKIADGYPMGELDNLAEYSAVHKLVFFGGGDESSYYPGDQTRMLYKLDAAGNITRLPDPPIKAGSGSSIMTVDPVSGNLLIFDYYSTNSCEYDVFNDRWTMLSVPHPRILAGVNDRSAVAASITEYGVIMVVVYDFSSSKVYLYKHSAGTGMEKDVHLPSNGHVVTAYPNPFFRNTTITLPMQKEKGAISIYDVSGKLVKREYIHSGSYIWNSHNLPSGTYLLKAIAGNRVMEKVLLLQK